MKAPASLSELADIAASVGLSPKPFRALEKLLKGAKTMADEKKSETLHAPLGAPPVVTGGTDMPSAGGPPKPPPKPEEPDPDDEPAKK
jgi:hypothetical protein